MHSVALIYTVSLQLPFGLLFSNHPPFQSSSLLLLLSSISFYCIHSKRSFPVTAVAHPRLRSLSPLPPPPQAIPLLSVPSASFFMVGLQATGFVNSRADVYSADS